MDKISIIHNKMEFKHSSAIDIKNWFCSKTDDELASYLISHIVNGDDTSTFRKTLPKKMVDNWVITLELLSGKRILLPLGTSEQTMSIILELQMRYKNCAHHELNRIRAEFSSFIDQIKV